jgi:hypothetical protein
LPSRGIMKIILREKENEQKKEKANERKGETQSER